MFSLFFSSLAALAFAQETDVQQQVDDAPVEQRRVQPVPPSQVIPAPVKRPSPAPRSRPTPAVPLSNPGQWVTSNDYPLISMLMMEEGSTRFLLLIGANGRVDSCVVVSSSGFPRLDRLACRQLERRARFRPATDGKGEATTGTYRSAVRWVQPGNNPIPAASLGWKRPKEAREQKARGVVRFSVTVDRDGKIADCRVLKSSQFPLLDRETCMNIRRLQSQSPGRDKEGAPAPRRFTNSVRW